MRTNHCLFSISLLLAACGGATQSESERPSGADRPADALSCQSEARIDALATDARPGRAKVVTDGAYIYWIRRGGGDAGQIVRSALDGGAFQILASGVAGESLAVDGRHVYFTERKFVDGAASVSRIVKSGGDIEPFAASKDDWHLKEAWEIALDEDAVYWSGTNGQCVMRQPKAGGGVSRVSCNEDAQRFALGVDDSYVYWVELPRSSREPATLRRASKLLEDRGTAQVVATGDTFRPGDHDVRTSLAVDDQAIYWLSHHDGTVVRIAKSNGARTDLASDQRDFVSIAQGGGFVYWAWGRGGEEGAVSRVPKTGGRVELLASKIRPAGIAYDERGLVVTTSDGIARLATCPSR